MAAADDDDAVLDVRVKWAVFGDFRACLPVGVMLLISPVWILLLPKATLAWYWLVPSLTPVVLFALYLLGHILPMRMRIGNDGLTLRWLFGWSRFIPFREIREHRAMTRDRKSLFGFREPMSTDVIDLIELFVGKKERLRLLCSTSGRPPIRARIERGVAQARAENDRVLEERLSRRGRPVGEWLGTALRDASGDHYRAGAVGRDQLLQTATLPTAAPTARVAAAAALRNLSLDDEERVRIRVAAASSLAPGVREALEAAAEAEAAEAEVTSLAARVRES